MEDFFKAMFRVVFGSILAGVICGACGALVGLVITNLFMTGTWDGFLGIGFGFVAGGLVGFNGIAIFFARKHSTRSVWIATAAFLLWIQGGWVARDAWKRWSWNRQVEVMGYVHEGDTDSFVRFVNQSFLRRRIAQKNVFQLMECAALRKNAALLNRVVVLDESGQEGSALCAVAKYGSAALVAQLLDAGYSVHPKYSSNGFGCFPVFAVFEGATTTPRCALSMVGEFNEFMRGAPSSEECSDRAKRVELLVKAGASRSQGGQTAIGQAATTGCFPTMLSSLLSLGEGIDQPDASQPFWTPLMYAAASSFPENVAAALDAGADTSLRDKEGKTAMQLAEDRGPDSPAAATFRARGLLPTRGAQP